ncbi:MAG: TraB/GumN family protein [Deltaproteobacteria bacterium]|nr:TraB/GumN family protein [Deltaproteobacteria bacterium]
MITEFTIDRKHIILIGTAHISQKSVELVRDMIEDHKPDTVCIELCESRYKTIVSGNGWQDMDIIKVIKEKKVSLLLSNLILASFQKKIAAKLDIKPGAEMLQAIESANLVNAKIWLADRDIRTTLSRAWRSMGLWNKIKVVFQLSLSIGSSQDITEEEIEKMKQTDVLENLIKEVGKSMPILKEILIDERDKYLAEKIRNASGDKIIAVVGAGHVPGITKYIEKSRNIEELDILPKKNGFASLLKWAIPAFIFILFILGFSKGGFAAGKEMILWWILANGIFASIGAAIAMGHPYTIISSFLAAPLTSLNPMIAAGWVSGLVEAFSRKPKVKDCESLAGDILTVKGFFKNKITRILLIVVFTNIGSMIGTMVALPMLLKVL